MTDLIPGVGAGSLLKSELLADGRSVRIGAIHRLDFQEAVVLTHDRWKHEAGGIPQYSFLLATAQNIDAAETDDDEVLLLRVEGTAQLAMENELHAVREEALRTALSKTTSPSPTQVLDVDVDPFTRNRISFTGLRCKVLGTFYEENVNGDKILEFGADVDNFYAASTYRVLKPVGEGLAAVASYLKPSKDDPLHVPIGVVRFSATRRRARMSGQAASRVTVNINDFIGHKTALLGMTRMGKSNTAKTIIAQTFIVSEKQRRAGDRPIGQLVFDPQGEYANPNSQDGTEIAAIGEKHVSIFKFGADSNYSHVKPLNINFFAEDQIDAVQDLISDQLADETAGYVKDFAGTSYDDDPTSRSATSHAIRARFVLYGALLLAGFKAPPDYRANLVIKGDLQKKVNERFDSSPFQASRQGPKGPQYVSVGEQDIPKVINTIIELRNAGDMDAIDFTKDARWQNVEPIFTTKDSRKTTVRGWRNLNGLRPFHSPLARKYPADEIYDELLGGRIVIVDLHVGAQNVTTRMSESIVRRIIARQTDFFTRGSDVKPPQIQIMLEEAHNLFASDKYKDDTDVWVKLAKEASKLRLGMTYATQEVSGVAHQVRANTANWVVAHLNNTKELTELSRFYDFGSFADAILSSEDRGYVRLKTLSSPFIVPVQIDLYDRDLVNAAREAAGDPPLTEPEPTLFDGGQ